MPIYSTPSRRQLTVIAQDPTVTTPDGKVLMTKVWVPAESLRPGPCGHRVHVVDFDSSKNVFYRPRTTELEQDLYEGVCSRKKLESDPHFHAQNVYAIVSATLLTFENALGRHVSWGFDANYGAHQIKVAPHAFADANAFYSRRDEGLLFGYFPARDGQRRVFTCLSHDIIVHETTHAVLDGLRRQYIRRSSSDQAAFHEGFADIVALLSVLQSEEIIQHGLSRVRRSKNGTCRLVDVLNVVDDSFLSGLAKQMGEELEVIHRSALRQSVRLPPSPRYLDEPHFEEAHTRGEILVAAVMRAFLAVWWTRLLGKTGTYAPGDDIKKIDPQYRVEFWRVAEEGATTATHLLRMLIRALDYMPPIDIEFGDFLSAAITADSEACPDDSKYRYRRMLLDSFNAYGIKPASPGREEPGRWNKPEGELTYGHAHFDAMKWDREAIFRFIWENREALDLVDEALTLVESVRPAVRLAPDGFVLREVVVEYYQLITLQAGELGSLGLKMPEGMPEWQSVRLYGGSTLIFDEFGHLKYDIGNSLKGRRTNGKRRDSTRQNKRLQEMWERGEFSEELHAERRFARLHRERALYEPILKKEQW